jgi:CRISPR-associated protein Cas1
VKNYYVLSNGRVKREHNTLYIENEAGEKKPVPIEDVDCLYLYGEVDLNTKLLNFLSQKRIPLHVFNYYGFYAGSYYPREYLHSGHLLVHQVAHYADKDKRLHLTRELVRGSAHSLLRNVAYYANRKGGAADTEPPGEVGLPEPLEASSSPAIPTDADAEAAVDASLAAPALLAASADTDPLTSTIDFDSSSETAHVPLATLRTVIESLAALVDEQTEVNALRGVEGKMRERYYHAWRHILTGGWAFERRVRRPPDNEVNALISFGNSVLYTVCLSEIYRTQLTPTISYLHEPGARRFSLALDISEIFKPLIVDRAIFRLLNTGQLTPAHFDRSLDGCYLNDAGKRLFLGSLEERLKTTIKHRRLGRSVSYRHLIRLECYKLIRHLTDVEPYRAFRAWW